MGTTTSTSGTRSPRSTGTGWTRLTDTSTRRSLTRRRTEATTTKRKRIIIRSLPTGHTGMTTTTTTKKTATGLTRSLTITPLPTDTASTRRGGRRTDTGGASTHDVRTEEGGESNERAMALYSCG